MSERAKFRHSTIISAAKFYVRSGLSVIPIRADGSKAPALARGEVEQYRERFASAEELDRWFGSDKAVGLAVVCGKISGNLAVLDFESQQAWQNWQRRCEELGLTHLYESFPRVVTPRGGRHVYCRIREGWASGGKLAMRSKSETLVEVRGQGHYVLAPGCPAACHELNREYEFESLGWAITGAVSVDIALEDYESLCNVAKEFNEYVPADRLKTPAPTSSDAKGDRPGDDYNRRASWSEILEPHGWKVDKTSGDVTYWTRPGKTRGVSATTGKCHTEGSGDLLYVFTGNSEFEQDAAYSKFAAYTILEHAGEFTDSAKRLADLGYGKNDPTVMFPSSASIPAGGGVPDDGVQPDYEFATNADLKQYDLGINWIWEGWFQKSTVNLLSAEGGAGKTRFVLDLCRRVHLGQAWPDGVPTAPWKHPYLAMWVAGDRNHGELLENSEKFGFGDRICYSGSKKDPLGGITLNTREDFSTLYKRVKAAKPMFLVVDTAGGATSYNLAKQEEARTFFAPLSDMALRLSLCVIVITHLNASKNTYGKRAEERVRTVIRITSEDRKAETKRRIEVQKSNALFPEPLGMTLRETCCDYDLDPPEAPRAFGDAGGQASSPDKGPPTKVRECVGWLTKRLEEAPVRESVLRSEIDQEAKFSTDVFYKAMKKMSTIKTMSQGFSWIALKKEAQM